MQLNAKGPGCKPQGANWFHVLDFFFFFQARLGTTPFSTPSGHVYRRTFRIEDVMHSAELVVPLILGAVQRQVTNCTFICCWRKRQTTWRRCCIARWTRVAKIQITQRAASGSCPGSFHEYCWSGSVSLINRTKTIRWPKLTWTSLRKVQVVRLPSRPTPSRFFSTLLRPPKLRSSKVEKFWGTRNSTVRTLSIWHSAWRVWMLWSTMQGAPLWPSGSYLPWWSTGWRVCMLHPRWAEHPRFWHLHGRQCVQANTHTSTSLSSLLRVSL